MKRLMLKRIAPLMLSCAVLSLAVPLPSFADEIRSRLLTVTGTGIERVPTTITRVRLAVEVQGSDAAAVQRNVAQRTAQVIELLRSQGVDRLQTTGVSLQPRYERREGLNENRLVGYVGSNSVAFQIATEEAGTVIDRAVSSGVSRIDGVEFMATDTVLDAAKADALRQATANARSEARIVLASLGLQEEEIVGIEIHSSGYVSPMRSNAIQFEAADTLVGGDQTVSATVTLEIRY
ncbi:SIMPL domain-containing protein [Spirulina major]|uniref:SIMPL domain-containing protein n=1 Tax=Spirulina major TaxID=270636 RepID=UPI000932C8DA|nr:SIMPL domain-containing protein [Spirulina major]